MATTGLDIYQPVRDPTERGFKMSSYRGASSSSSDEYTHTRDTAPLLSTLEASGNDNNQRIASMMSSSTSRRTERDSSSVLPSGTLLQSLQREPSSSSLLRKDSKTSSISTSSRASSNLRATQHNTSMVSAGKDGEDVIIEEKRKRAHGDGYTIHRYLRGRMLGKGGFAKVYLCTAMDTNKQYAVKVVPKSNLVKARARQKLQAEIKIHRTLKHRHVCEYKHFFEDRNNCYILLELCHNQSMNEMIKRRKRLTEPEAAYFMLQLTQAVRYMHDNNVIHRDLKLGNLFLDKNIHIKVGDLGLATRVEDKDEKRKTICGTPNYIAPEVIQGDRSKRGHSFEVDIWSMGVILYTVLIGKPPYEAKDVKATYQRILNNEYSFPSHVDVSDNAKDLIESMLQSSPSDRPSLDEIESHPFFKDNLVPAALPLGALHSTPAWRVNEFGEIFCFEEGSSRSKYGKLPRTLASRQPFGFRDPNSKASAALATSSNASKRPERNIDMQRIVRSALAMSAGSSSSPTTMASKKSAASSKVTSSSSGFKIFDESGGSTSHDARAASQSKPPQPRSSPITEETLVRRTRALAISDSASRPKEMLRSPSAVSSVSSVGGGDAEVLNRMIDRLDIVLEITQNRKGMYRSQMPRPVSSTAGPSKWVTRYVDYTSKYGLGFLLNDGSSGVYFNDSTKTALDSSGQTFQYIERKKLDDTDLSTRRVEATVETHSLHSYPESLKKKVTLLKHFQNYLLEQQKDEGDGNPSNSHQSGAPMNLVYVKKWVRTKHAILFRLSNQTVQVVFYDQTEVLMTADDRYITYVDKNRKRATYNFTDDLVGSSAELEKRLKYTKEIMGQLITGRR